MGDENILDPHLFRVVDLDPHFLRTDEVQVWMSGSPANAHVEHDVVLYDTRYVRHLVACPSHHLPIDQTECLTIE